MDGMRCDCDRWRLSLILDGRFTVATARSDFRHPLPNRENDTVISSTMCLSFPAFGRSSQQQYSSAEPRMPSVFALSPSFRFPLSPSFLFLFFFLRPDIFVSLLDSLVLFGPRRNRVATIQDRGGYWNYSWSVPDDLFFFFFFSLFLFLTKKNTTAWAVVKSCRFVNIGGLGCDDGRGEFPSAKVSLPETVLPYCTLFLKREFAGRRGRSQAF
ncbi:uncharacterized protein B0T23DRAFT_120247 [Neurospora hispaniola]|uniref:Transmembrane protein n=1 Tax=Neurospora hispaniola TaxID=588809 RepID=A0AAJ0IAF1_9PEZI|nr:hypothetical protein B0T23DRAFT_120247 [Neurospora hispaniola]